MQILSISEPLDPPVPEWPEGTHYNSDDSGHWLHLFFRDPLPVEVNSIQAGPAEFGLFVHDSVIFLLFRFGMIPLNDAPYSWWLVSEESRAVPEVRDDLHALLKVVLVDVSSGLVSALRVLTFSAELTKRLHQEIPQQTTQPWNPERHNEGIEHVHNKFNTLNLVGRSLVMCRGGE
ncbi:hypothetical protein ACFL2Q_18610 [Thermodesulfobacteriota bacterium]